MFWSLALPPCPARAEIEFAYATQRGIRIVKSFGREHDPLLLQEPVQHGTTVGQTGKFDTFPVDVLNNRTVTRDDQLS